MLAEERRNRILEILKDEEFFPVTDLVKRFGVSRITIVRDLAALEEEGVITRVYGGATVRKEDLVQYEAHFKVRIQRNLPQKQAIGIEAAKLVKDNSTIFIDSSTTGYTFAGELMRLKTSRLNIITNSPSVLNMAGKRSNTSIIATGGELNTTFNMLGGLWVVDFLNKINIDAAFISASGISQQFNLTTSSIDLANILNKVIERSNQTNVLADSSKLGKRDMVNICMLSQCSRLITDDGITPEQEQHFREAVEVTTARCG